MPPPLSRPKYCILVMPPVSEVLNAPLPPTKLSESILSLQFSPDLVLPKLSETKYFLAPWANIITHFNAYQFYPWTVYYFIQNAKTSWARICCILDANQWLSAVHSRRCCLSRFTGCCQRARCIVGYPNSPNVRIVRRTRSTCYLARTVLL